MSTPRKGRRAVLAELLLLADPTDIRTRGDGVSLSFNFDSIAELRSWLESAGLNSPDLLTSERTHTDDDGRPFRAMHAFPTWHGWKIYAFAKEYTSPDLDPTTTEQLTALAVTG